MLYFNHNKKGVIMAFTSNLKKWVGWDEGSDYSDDNVYQYDNGYSKNDSTAPVQSEAIHSMVALQPRTYNDARQIGEAFRSGMTTVVNLSAMNDADGRRIVDFASGLIMGLHGNIERVDTKVFILAPNEIDILAPGETDSTPATSFYNIG
jgi:FtsZ-interacting cell division protein YlmF